MPIATGLDRERLAAWYRRNRERSRAIFDLLADEAYYAQPIALRHPIVFYDGHLPAFSFNTLVKKGLGRPGIDPRLETLFARGIDPHEQTVAAAASGAERADAAGAGRRVSLQTSAGAWPSREEVRAFADEADRQVLDAILNADIDQPDRPLLDRAEAAFAILEHEAMHQETLLYMWHRLPFSQKHRPAGYSARTAGAVPPAEWIHVPAGRATLGVERGSIPFGWDNEFGAYSVDVPAFRIERHDVTNARFLEFVEAGGYADPRWWTPENWKWVRREGLAHPLFWERSGGRWLWRGMFELIPLPWSWPVYVSHAEALAYARWSGARLPSEAEFQRAAYGSPVWSETQDEDSRAPLGVFDFASWEPGPAGSHPRGASAWGVEDLVGNGWEWTSTVFAPFPGFTPMASYPEYSADFFDGEHFVMKGASPATARELLRPTFRNWFRGRYPYVYATFRCVKSA
jgi:ergothioneine biosynthesis protein EgtB